MRSLGADVLLKGTNFLRLLEGLWVALKISLISAFFSIGAGLVVGMLWTAKNRLVTAILKIWLEIVRIMPQLVLLFIVYFGTTRLFGWELSAEGSAVIVFSFWGAAEMGDLVRGAVISIPKIQHESAEALGMTQAKAYSYVILPQTIRRLVPLSINLTTRMIKTTSLIMMIGIVEVLKSAQQIVEANRISSPNAAFGAFAVVFLLYFVICWSVSRLAAFLEKRWSEL